MLVIDEAANDGLGGGEIGSDLIPPQEVFGTLLGNSKLIATIE